MKPTLKAPGTERSKLKYDVPPSKIAFKVNLRRYNVAIQKTADNYDARSGLKWDMRSLRLHLQAKHGATAAGAYTRPLFGST